MKRNFISFLLVAIFIFVAEQLFSQGCSQCRLMTEQGRELDENSFGTNINSGILYLMAIPYLLLMFLFRKKIISLFRGFAKK
ncbi:MAG: hypothetical protein ACK50Y_12195 [Flavobacteriia bacterium]|jgi:hypothetical protein